MGNQTVIAPDPAPLIYEVAVNCSSAFCTNPLSPPPGTGPPGGTESNTAFLQVPSVTAPLSATANVTGTCSCTQEVAGVNVDLTAAGTSKQPYVW